MSISKLGDAIADLVTALQAIQGPPTFNLTLKGTSIVNDPTSLETLPTTSVPFIVLWDVALEKREFDPAMRVKDYVTLNLYMRADAAPLGSGFNKMTTWLEMVADVETALCGTPALRQRSGLCLDTELLTIKPSAASADPSNAMVLLLQPIRLRMQPRSYGQPTSQG